MTSSRADRKAILIVDDEAILQMLAAEIVEDAGFEPLTAADANRAIETLAGRSDICIVFADIGLPGSINGLELARMVRDRWPSIELIVTSGQGVASETLPERTRFLLKPYDPDALTQMILSLVAFPR